MDKPRNYFSVIGKFNRFFFTVNNDLVRFRYIGQLKITNFPREDASLLRRHVEAIMGTNRSHFSLKIVPDTDTKLQVCALLTLPASSHHRWTIDQLDGRQFNGNILICKPNGFTDLESTNVDLADYSAQKHLVDDFNGRFYHLIDPQEAPRGLMSLDLPAPTTPSTTKRKQITHSESNDSLLQTIVAKEIKVEADDDGWELASIKREPDTPSTSSETIVEPSIEAPELPGPVNEECFTANWQRQVICCDCGRAMPWFHIVDHECSRDRPDYLS